MKPSPRLSRLIAALVASGVLAAACAGGSGDTDERNAVAGRRIDRRVGAGTEYRPLRFAVIGDQGSGTTPQHEVAQRMCAWRADHPFRLVFTTGDNVYDHGEPSRFQDTFYEPYACLLNNGARFHASLGNHDVQTANGNYQVQEPAFGYENERRNYVIRKKGVRFVVADATDLRERWLRRNTRAEKGDRWTIVIFHFPVYSSGGYGTYADWHTWMPDLFVRRGVDLVLNGHDHLYSVTKRLRKIRYVVTGGGGAGLYACTDRWFTAFCLSTHHFLYVVAGKERLRIRAIPRNGPPFHRFKTWGRGEGG